MGMLRRPEKIWVGKNGKRKLSQEYLYYLHSLTRLTYDEKETFREIGVHLTNAKISRIEDYYGTRVFIEGGQ